jgi:hypothetical protein
MPSNQPVSIGDPGENGVLIKQFESINIRSGHIITTLNACKGLILYSKGDVIIDGAIDMSKKGGMSPTFIDVLRLGSSPDKMLAIKDEVNNLKGGAGGAGGNSQHYYSAYGTIYGGNGVKGRKFLGGFGGGGAGGGGYYVQGGKGGGITIDYIVSGFPTPAVKQSGYNGSAATPNDGNNGAGGAGGARHGFDSMSTYALSGAGGISYGAGGGGGGGALVINGGAIETGGAGGAGEYAGGFILIIAKGSIIINGQIKSDGGTGGGGGGGAFDGANYVNGAGGGGGAGGGVIALLYKETLTNKGSITVAGGLGGVYGYYTGTGAVAGTNGAAGSVGTIYTRKID